MDELQKRIDEMVKGSKVFLFMKGTPAFPQCGFSAQVVALLKEVGAEFGSFNVLSDESIRQGVKEYSNWPTFPQLFVDGQLVGGCDIVTDLYEADELPRTLGLAG